MLEIWNELMEETVEEKQKKEARSFDRLARRIRVNTFK